MHPSGAVPPRVTAVTGFPSVQPPRPDVNLPQSVLGDCAKSATGPQMPRANRVCVVSRVPGAAKSPPGTEPTGTGRKLCENRPAGLRNRFEPWFPRVLENSAEKRFGTDTAIMATMAGGQGRSREALANGTKVQGYVIESLLGWGRFGPVYRALDAELGATVALKEYLPEGVSERDGTTVRPLGSKNKRAFANGRRGFLEQARQLAKLRGNQSIPDCLDFFAASGTAYWVMEFIDGHSLETLLSGREGQGQTLEEAELASIITPLLTGLANVHATGVLHGGIRPSNILVERTNRRPVLIGFAASKGLTESERRVADGYVAIEQVGEGAVGQWTDLYAVGAVMWRIVAGGNPPWQPPDPVKAKSRMDAVARRQPDPLPSAMKIGAGRFANETLTAIDKCLRLPELERVQDCPELLGMIAEKAGTPAPGSSKLARASGREESGAAAGRANAWVRKVFSQWPGKMSHTGVAATVGAFLLGTLLGIGSAEREPESADPTSFGRFAIETEPENAQVRLLDIDGSYWPGMFLPDGQYNVEVSAEGYESKVLSVRHDLDPTTERVSLSRSELKEPQAPAGFSISVTPATAEVRLLNIEERYRDRMPLPAGMYRVEVSADGYETEILSVQHGSEPTTESVSLRRRAAPRMVAGFTIQAQPPSARVRVLNIKERYRAGMGLPEGTYQVEVAADGYETVLKSVRHGPEPTTELIALQRPGASLTIEVEPEGAQVRLLDVDDSYAPGMSLPEGRYRVEVSADGYDVIVRSIEHGVEPTVERVVLERLPSVPKTFEFVRIPAGEFVMGSTSSEADEDERPVTRVLISRDFEMGRHEVTQEQWVSVMQSNPSTFSSCGSDCPVENVSWEDVQEFVRKLNAAAGSVSFRLPTEAEWEYAARAGATEDRYGSLEETAWWDGNAGFGTQPVGRKAPNDFGLHDMVGNVYEWVQDWYGDYPGGAVVDPRGQASGSRKVARGGGWSGDARACRSTNRYASRSDVRTSFIGLRLVRVVP